MALASLPPEITLNIATYLRNNTSALRKLSQTCKSLHRICQPLLYRKIHVQEPRNILLPIAYTIFTCPNVARGVRSIRLPALSIAPSLAQQQSLRNDGKRQKLAVRQEWPEQPDLDSVLKDQVATALEGEDAETIQACFSAVRDGTREDLIVMLILMNTTCLEELYIGAVGPRGDDSHTRSMFRHAAPRLTKLKTVHFGRTPKDLSTSSDPRTDLEISHSLFADLFRLPAISEMRVFAIGPRQSEDIPESEWDTFFDFIYDIKSDNTSLKRLLVTEQLASSNAHLDHIFKHCPALDCFEFMSRDDSGTNDMMYDWGTQWDRETLQRTLESRADSLHTLVLPDCLFHDEATLADPRSELKLRDLYQLDALYISNGWIFAAADMGDDNETFDAHHVEQRLVSLLPDSIKSLRIGNPGDGGQLDEMMNITIRTLIERHRAHKGFPNLELLQLEEVTKTKEGLKFYKDTFNMAKAAGVRIFLIEDATTKGYWW